MTVTNVALCVYMYDHNTQVSNVDTVLLFFLLNQDQLTSWLEALRSAIE